MNRKNIKRIHNQRIRNEGHVKGKVFPSEPKYWKSNSTRENKITQIITLAYKEIEASTKIPVFT